MVARCENVKTPNNHGIRVEDIRNNLQVLLCLININMVSLKCIALSDNVFRYKIEQNELVRVLTGIPLQWLSCYDYSGIQEIDWRALAI